MKYLADLHTHSLYSRATSASSHLFGLAAWAAIKGLAVLGTGDFTHPAWFAHLHDCLEEAEPGFFKLKEGLYNDYKELIPSGMKLHKPPESIRFILSSEISSIYKRDGQVRKVHNLLYAPDFASVQRINTRLASLGNISSDGRPILGLDARDLLDILLGEAPEGFLVPAHIWTPWFSLFGSKSGFDSIDECFGDLSRHIFALETGLSSDPEMNRHISALDRFTLISNSDCHSPAKLGREANLLDTDFDYFALKRALQAPLDEKGRQVFAATVEFYPEEGKYHSDGHRRCGVCLDPAETRKLNGICPHCGGALTIGVLHRVMELADRDQPLYPRGHPQAYSLIPLVETLAELLDCGPTSKKVTAAYTRMLNTFGPEFHLLLEVPEEEIRTQGFSLLAEAVSRMRNKRVHRQSGYDGEFGQIKVFAPGERALLQGQGMLFAPPESKTEGQTSPKRAISKKRKKTAPDAAETIVQPLRQLNAEQQRAVDSAADIIVVQAGPGTGKTHTLVSRVRRIALSSPLPCTIITFTNRAAAELRERLRDAANGEKIRISTFHGYCLTQLRRTQPELQVVGPEERGLLLADFFSQYSEKERRGLSCRISLPANSDQDVEAYHQYLAERALIDLDAIVSRAVAILSENGPAARAIREATGHLFIDEFQDVNSEQYQLTTLLAQTSTVFAIGDPDQAIYSFRGADPQWFHALAGADRAECHHLVHNYRSGEQIIQAAEALIHHNAQRRPVPAMRACCGKAGALHVQACANAREEASWIADQMEGQLGGISHRSLERMAKARESGGQYSFRDFAVLYRTARQARVVAKLLAERGIPFQIVELEAFYTQGPCRLLYEWLLLLAGLADAGQWLFVLGQEKGVGTQSLALISRHLRRLTQQEQERTDLFPRMQALPDISPGAAAACGRLTGLYRHLRELATAQPPEALLAALAGHYGLDPQEPNLQRLRELVLAHGASLHELAVHLQVFSDSVLYDSTAEAVTLSTLHAAKGLEFPVVFIAGLEADTLPLKSHASGQSDPARIEAHAAHVEEERRLLYVGLTRAIDYLWLSWRQWRASRFEANQAGQPSPFLAEIPAELIAPVPVTGRKKRKQGPKQLSLFS